MPLAKGARGIPVLTLGTDATIAEHIALIIKR